MLCSKSIASMYGTKLLKLRMMTKVRKNKDPKDPPKQLSTEPHCNTTFRRVRYIHLR